MHMARCQYEMYVTASVTVLRGATPLQTVGDALTYIPHWQLDAGAVSIIITIIMIIILIIIIIIRLASSC